MDGDTVIKYLHKEKWLEAPIKNLVNKRVTLFGSRQSDYPYVDGWISMTEPCDIFEVSLQGKSTIKCSLAMQFFTTFYTKYGLQRRTLNLQQILEEMDDRAVNVFDKVISVKHVENFYLNYGLVNTYTVTYCGEDHHDYAYFTANNLQFPF